MTKTLLLSLSILFASLSNAFAADNDMSFDKVFNIWKDNIKQTWKCKQSLDIHVPLRIWHNRLTYDSDKIKEYNEQPWGLGTGVSRVDEDGDWHSLYVMAFEDSNHHPQTIFGYAYQKNWYFGKDENWHAGVGITTALTQREEYYYIPLPLPLPIAGVGYKNFGIHAAYVPGLGSDNGNVLFTWARISI